MKRFLLLPAVLLLALSVRAQEGEEAPPEPEPQQETPQEAAAPSEGEPVGEPVEDAEADEPAEKEEPLISVKVEGASGNQERDEDSVEVAEPKKRAVPSATVMKRDKKSKRPSASDKAAKSKAVKTAPVVAKGKSPVTSVPTAPAAPPPPAVPLTPITPRNP